MTKRKKVVKKRSGVGSHFFHFIAWLTGVLVSLAVGFGMIDGVLTAQNIFIPVYVTVAAGWIVVGFTVLGTLLSILGKIS
jgi:hypothetical protein